MAAFPKFQFPAEQAALKRMIADPTEEKLLYPRWRAVFPIDGNKPYVANGKKSPLSGTLPPAELAANVHLIAAAPELLEALSEMVRVFSTNKCDSGALVDAIDAAQVAIKHAKGES